MVSSDVDRLLELWLHVGKILVGYKRDFNQLDRELLPGLWERLTRVEEMVGQLTFTHPLTPDSRLNLSIQDLGLSVRSTKALEGDNIRTIRDLLDKTAEDLIEIMRFGMVSLREVREKLAAHGLKLRGD